MTGGKVSVSATDADDRELGRDCGECASRLLNQWKGNLAAGCWAGQRRPELRLTGSLRADEKVIFTGERKVNTLCRRPPDVRA
jgi:hypothetical protein